MRRNLFLHFINRDSREIFQLFRFHNDGDHSQILSRALNAAVLLCEDHCVMPPGFALEDQIAFELSERKSAFFRAGILQLPMRESNLSDYAEKKRMEYMPLRDRYTGLFSDRRLDFLGRNALGLIRRKSKIGERILISWEDAPDKKIWGDVKKILTAPIIEAVRRIPAVLADGEIALTWSAIEPRLPQEARAAASPLRNSLQHIYFKQYCEEYNLVILARIPHAVEEFSLPRIGSVYNCQRLSLFLDAFYLNRFFLNCDAETLLSVKREMGATKFVDAYASLAQGKNSDTELRFSAQRAREAIRFDWSGFAKRNSSLLREPSHLEVRELIDALSDAANELVKQNGLSDREGTKTIMTRDAAREIRERRRMAKVVLFVALREELDVLVRQLNLTKNAKNPRATGMLNGIEVDVLCADAMGRVPAAVETAIYLTNRKGDLPELIIILGLAGGFAEAGTELGNIICGQTVVDLASRKIVDEDGEGLKTRFRRIDFSLDRSLEMMLDSSDFDKRHWENTAIDIAEWPEGRRPSVKAGLIASGDEVIASEDWRKKMLSHTGKLLGVEMEAGGVCAAAEKYGVKTCLLRAVSDNADPAKSDDEWRKVGMKTLSLLLKALDFNKLLANLKSH